MAVITGVKQLNSAPVQAVDLRAGAAMIIAGLLYVAVYVSYISICFYIKTYKINFKFNDDNIYKRKWNSNGTRI